MFVHKNVSNNNSTNGIPNIYNTQTALKSKPKRTRLGTYIKSQTETSQKAKAIAQKKEQELKEHSRSIKDRLTQSKAFERLVDWAYRVCDSKKTNHISSEQLYSGLLLVHLNLAKYCGAAACMPPSRTIVEELFETSDVDDSGGIDREEFNIIVKVSCAQIFSRVLINYATMIFVIPFLAKILVDKYFPDPESNTYLEIICIQFISVLMFILIVPNVWKIIDKLTHMEAGRQATRKKSERKVGKLQSDDEFKVEEKQEQDDYKNDTDRKKTN